VNNQIYKHLSIQITQYACNTKTDRFPLSY